MKRFFLTTFLVGSVLFAQAQSIVMPQPSPTQTIKQNFGIGNVELSYSRPALKGRKFGADLVPFGKLWRTGANAATTIQFSEDVTIGGVSIKAGKYGILSIPDAKEWTIIITKDLNINNPSLYKQENDVVRVKASVMKLNDKVEALTMNFSNFTNTSCDLMFMWENSAVALPITNSSDEKIMKQISDVVIKDVKPYYSAAQYYFDNGKDMSQAKEWIDKASADPANAKSANVFWLKARIYQKMGDKSAARANAEKTVTLATEAKNEDLAQTAENFLKTLK